MSEKIQQVKRAKRVRMSDVAREAAVSLATVSKVLMSSPGNNTRVSEATAARIRVVAEKLKFSPNQAARQLAGERSQMLGVVIDSMAPEVRFHTLSRLEHYATSRGYRLMVGQGHERPELLVQYAEDFSSRGVDGVFCLAPDYPAGFYSQGVGETIVGAFARLKNVLFVGEPQTEFHSLPYVDSDKTAGIKQAYSYLRANGRNRICMVVANQRYLASIQRMRGFEDAVESDGRLDAKSMIFVGDHQFSSNIQPGIEFVSAAIQRLIFERKADAIIASNDLLAVHLIKGLKRFGLKVPDDVAVIGYDNLQLAELYEPALTTVDHNLDALCMKAMATMLRMIAGDQPIEPRGVLVQPYLIPRESA